MRLVASACMYNANYRVSAVVSELIHSLTEQILQYDRVCPFVSLSVSLSLSVCLSTYVCLLVFVSAVSRLTQKIKWMDLDDIFNVDSHGIRTNRTE